MSPSSSFSPRAASRSFGEELLVAQRLDRFLRELRGLHDLGLFTVKRTPFDLQLHAPSRRQVLDKS